jgi:hypothetical protein
MSRIYVIAQASFKDILLRVTLGISFSTCEQSTKYLLVA